MKNKFTAAALSVVIALLLWLYVITTISPGSKQTFYNIPLVLGNESVLTERGLMITYQSASSVTLELSGNRTDLAKVNTGNITVKADLSNIYEPGNQIPVGYTVSFPGNVASNAFVTESRSPSRIYLNVERRVSKAIPVEVKWIGSVPDGFIADRDNMLLEYSTIQISGPESVANQIEKAVIEIDLTDLRESISWDCPYTLCNADDEPVDAGLITTNADQIHLEVRIQRVKDVALTYHLVEGGGAKAENAEITLSTDKIRVSGSEAALELVKRGHQLAADDVVDICRVSDDRLVGEAPEMVRHFMEIRGIGIIDIRAMYGVGSVILSKSIDMVIHMEKWDSTKEYDRLGLTEETVSILGVKVPYQVMPVKPGRNLAIIIEVAARNLSLKRMGYSAAHELDRRLNEMIAQNSSNGDSANS